MGPNPRQRTMDQEILTGGEIILFGKSPPQLIIQYQWSAPSHIHISKRYGLTRIYLYIGIY